MKEAILSKEQNVFICVIPEQDEEIDYLLNNFFGTVITSIDKLSYECVQGKNIYVCGDYELVYNIVKTFDFKRFYIIQGNGPNLEKVEFIDFGKVPINIFNVGVFYRGFFNCNLFSQIKDAHNFLSLTESNKSGSALRKGIYLSQVEKHSDTYIYNQLRCSTNLDGPTDNFKPIDSAIISNVNQACKEIFVNASDTNHVLAQIYENSEEGKAKIKAHSDKSEDMPKNGVISFYTCYDMTTFHKEIKQEMFDYLYKKTSVLTKLVFKLKKCVVDPSLEKEFSITLYPNSMFVIPLSTNRLYTHEIRPSILPFDKIPTRMGYVVRCSKTKAMWKNDQTFIQNDDEFVKLEPITEDDTTSLRALYLEENTTSTQMNYPFIGFSMNDGDYMKPNY